ncbi:hypothetical protein FZ934_18155 [Rhizobium grahamii]|uniref:Uncharacterized protein n=1 Tax=Rhizobium grahamii TaxID=1120045 RepID=A0A5Q0C869_9HYPH|nr:MULTISPECIES: hypothetical protein [Rhizobium]QFY62148.1 hypothetical protein FZ934_18155 [Rhizobium grahamii]QRM48669.1 hypothetical protein F3Y33_04740 [Rhizobium sp. BG6]
MRFGIFVAITLGFPFFVYGVIEITGARGTGGAAGALALVIGLYLKPLIYLQFALSLLRISIRRARALGISPLIGISVTLLVLADFAFGISFGSFWAVGFSLGILAMPLPVSLLMAAITVVTLSLLKDFDEPPANGRFERLYQLWSAALFVSVAICLLRILPYVSIVLFGSTSIAIAASRAVAFLNYVLIYPFGQPLVFAALSAALIVAWRRPPEAGGPSANDPSSGRQTPMFGQRAG